MLADRADNGHCGSEPEATTEGHRPEGEDRSLWPTFTIAADESAPPDLSKWPEFQGYVPVLDHRTAEDEDATAAAAAVSSNEPEGLSLLDLIRYHAAAYRAAGNEASDLMAESLEELADRVDLTNALTVAQHRDRWDLIDRMQRNADYQQSFDAGRRAGRREALHAAGAGGIGGPTCGATRN